MNDNELALQISELVQSTPLEIIRGIIQLIRNWEGVPTEIQKAQLLSSIHSPEIKLKLAKLIDCWTTNFPNLPPSGIFLSFQSSLTTSLASNSSNIELIWTGPLIQSSNLRRTDQALIELINSAKEELILVSFAVYKAQQIIKAIEDAILRDVRVIICLEDSLENQRKLSISGLNAFKSNIFRLASFYTWPIENRPHTTDGKYGSLHAKLAIADQDKVFISSANLTDYAMDLNIELGVFIEDKQIAEQIDDLFKNMIINSIFQKIEY